MKKLLKISALIAAMALSCAFFGCSNEDASDGNNSNSGGSTTSSSNNGNENSNDEQLNFVGTYGISKFEDQYKYSTEENAQEYAITSTMPTSSSLRCYETNKINTEGTIFVREMDYTVTKTENGYSFNWAKYDVNGEAQGEDKKAEIEAQFTNYSWNSQTEMFAMTLTTTADGKWSDNSEPASSGTYTVDEANSKVILTTLIGEGETLAEPEIMEFTYSNNGKTLVFVQDDSNEEQTNKSTITFTRK